MNRASPSPQQDVLLLLFFASGVSALLYQVCWQRMLFVAFGVDSESITIIVSTFMLGLGCGALAGGWLADRFPARAILLFALNETGIGALGLASPGALDALALHFAGAPKLTVGLISFFGLLLPTALMGATLPILVTHFTRLNRNVGLSIGHLYFSNTMGAAAGAALSAFIVFNHFTLNETVIGAAMINLATAAAGIGIACRTHREPT